MDFLSNLGDGFAIALTWQNLGLAVVGCIVGTLIGALPGLGPTNGVAILIPLAFTLGLPATPALILLTSVYYGAMYGGRISSILLNIPGDEPALMTTLDGYPMTKKGQAGEALAMSGLASFVGAFVATWGLIFLAPQLVKVALLFGPAEYFALFVLAFATLAGITATNRSKAVIAAAIGLGIAMIGIDHQTGVPRLTFGQIHLYDGIDFLVPIVGLFAISEVFMFLERHGNADVDPRKLKIARITAPFSMIRHSIGTMGRSSIVGFLCGVLPGAGASLGSFVAYTFERRLKNDNGSFGTGDPRGVAAPEAGNNAAAGGALVPMLALGVPGSGTTAVLLGMLMVLNITPGPLLFVQRPEVVWGLIAALFIANFVLLVLNIPMIGLFVRVLQVPIRYLMPAVAMISCVGIYGISGSSFDLVLMVVFGVVGYVLRKLDVPMVPIILGILLGTLMETNLRRALMISDGDVAILFSSPLAIAIWGVTLVGILTPMIVGYFSRRAARRSVATTP